MKTLVRVLAFIAGVYAGDAAVTALDSGSSISWNHDPSGGVKRRFELAEGSSRKFAKNVSMN